MGADVALVYNRSRGKADNTVAAVRALGPRWVLAPADVTTEQHCAQAVEATVAQLGRLDILKLLAGWGLEDWGLGRAQVPSPGVVIELA